jgi:hypothetical protein
MEKLKKKKGRLLDYHRTKFRRRIKKQNVPLCRSSTGLLVDVIEHNGFAVLSFERSEKFCDEWRISVRLIANKELLNERICKHFHIN